MSSVINLYDAKTNLSSLVDRAAAGEEIVIAKNGHPRAMLVPLPVVKAEPRRPQHLFGDLVIGDDFDDPLPEEMMRAFTGQGD